MKIDRLFAITNIIIDKKNITAAELAAHFGVSVRTIYRDIDILSSNGIPLYTSQGKGGGIAIIDGYSIDKTVLSDEEQKNVLVALESIKATGRFNVESSIHKLRNIFKKDMTDWIEIDFSGWEQSDAEKQIFEMIKKGIFDSTPLSFSYFSNNGENTKRIVEPLKLIFKSNSWYLYGFCRLRKDYRFFKLRRMDDLEIIEHDKVKVNLPEKISTFYEKETGKNIQLKLKIKESMAFRIYDEFRTGTINKSGDSLIVEAAVPDGEWLYNYLLSFGSSLEILEPSDLRKSYKKEIEKILKKHS